MKCPICKGSGDIESPKRLTPKDRKIFAAKALYDKGFSYQEIADLMGYKSKRSVSVLLKSN